MPSAEFLDAAAAVQKLAKKPGNDVLLKLYSLYKQATIGDNNTPRPEGMFDFTNKAKWEAWAKLEGMSQEEAEEEYITLADGLIKEQS